MTFPSSRDLQYLSISQVLAVVLVWVLYDLVVIFRFFEGKPVGVISLRNKSTESEESNLDSLLKLHNLHEKGVLDKAEYEDRKRKILSSDKYKYIFESEKVGRKSKIFKIFEPIWIQNPSISRFAVHLLQI